MTDLVVSEATERVISAVEQTTGHGRRKSGREWALRCPAHDDHSPSLHIREGDAGLPLIRCRSHNCPPDAILAAVGLTWADVLGNDDERWTPRGPWIAAYDYVDEDGRLLFQVCRTANKEFPQRHPNPDKSRGWEWNLNGTRRVPYRLPQVIAAAKVAETVYLPEGEKCVHALEQAGCVASTSPGGAGKWRDEYAQFFRGAHVIVVADWDDPGRAHALTIYRSLHGVAASVRIVRAKEGKDAADHLAAGFTVNDLVPVDPEELARGLQVETVTPVEGAEAGESADAGGAPRLRFLPGRDFVSQPLARIDPLLGTKGDGLLMPGSLMILAGIGGAGKTTLSMHAMAHWAAGLPWFGIPVARPIRCVVIENEGPHDPYVEKLKEFGDRFKGCTCSGEPHGDGDVFLDNCLFQDAPWGHFSFDDTGLAQELRDQVVEFRGDLVIANPLGRLGMKGAGTPEETRAFLQLLTNAGLGEDWAALLLHHLAKVQKGTPLVQQISGDWGPHPDTILIMEEDGERRSKLSFGKIRWGDQGRSPLILNWLTDPNGPIGYRTSDVMAPVADDELYDRIDEFLRHNVKPPGITAICRGVTGKGERIRELVEEGVKTGRYSTSGGGRPTFWLNAGGGFDHEQDALDV